ncbi:hypothetical protein M752DRAFT_276004 [Aspergillus phoenicis ATCC 13157]|uniref:Uncharacterized protein n=1 Tax=Aspergillus phoenicis ATCC 13157 TaxID=1353007 RepID=A0A370PL36_ASPPH|nr:hypothetical protein M752DRAFT_276004 [Aspergillus phoenicis ATCC 13157]
MGRMASSAQLTTLVAYAAFLRQTDYLAIWCPDPTPADTAMRSAIVSLVPPSTQSPPMPASSCLTH